MHSPKQGQSTDPPAPPAASAAPPTSESLSAQLEDQGRVFDTVLSSIPDFAYVFDLQGRFRYANKPLLDLWGLSAKEAVGKNFFDLKYPNDLAVKLHRQIQQVIDTQQRLSDETPYTNPAGATGYYEYVFSPVFAADGAVEAVAGCTRVITDRKRAEDAVLRISEEALAANRAKDRFLAVLSHELRTPLSPVVMTIPDIERDPDLPPKFREDMAMIRRNIDLEVKLIDDLLDLSRIASGKLRLQMKPIHAHEVLVHAIRNSAVDATAKHIGIRQELGAANDCLTGDAARLQQVFWNLVRNAVKFTPNGGEISVRTWNSADNGQLLIEIRDNGVGIPSDLLSRIFDAFEQGDARVTRQFGGLGLGLAIAKAVVEMHGGTIGAASDGHGLGATFTVRFNTVLDDSAVETGSPCDVVQPRQPAVRAKLLLVEDHPDTALTLARLLRGSGYEVKLAHSVASALQLADAEPFDIVLSDIDLPDATGYDLMRQIKRRHAMKGIAISGYGMENDIRKSREAGFIDHVIKPVKIEHLQAIIERMIASPNADAIGTS